MSRVRIHLEPVPIWLDARRLLGADPLTVEPLDGDHLRLTLELPEREAADIAASLRGLGFDGRALELHVEPPLRRSAVREARLRDARARRETTPGFVRPGALATGEGRFSLTPESLALELGQLAAGASVVDACCGSGGNTIGFARAGCTVAALDIEGTRLGEARHNAALYGVSDRIQFVHGDALAEVPARSADILFVDPPWGEQYDKRATSRASFPLLSALLSADLRGYRELWLKLPGSFEVASIPGVSARAFFGHAAGDARRVKFVLLRRTGS